MAIAMRFNRKKLVSAMTIALGLTLHAGWASAADVSSAPTDTVIGRAPVVAPTIANQSRPGQPPVNGEVVAVTSGFSDADQDTEQTTYVWKRGATVISGATTSTYTLVAADLGQTLTAEVTPETDATITEPAVGTMVPVTIVAATVAGNKPLSIAIHRSGSLLTGAPIVGDSLTAVPTCVTTCDPDLVYSWTVGGTSAGGSSDTYVVTKDDQKKAIVVSAPDVRATKRK